MKIVLLLCISLFFIGCVEVNKNTQTYKTETPSFYKNETTDSLKKMNTIVVDTVVKETRIKINYNWNDQSIIININDLIFDTSYYVIWEDWDLYTPIFEFQNLTKSNIYIKNNIICYALPFNHINTYSVFVCKINYLKKKIEICKDIKCSEEVFININEGILSTCYNKDPVNGIYKIKEFKYKISDCQ